MPRDYYVYILTNAAKTLYVGVTNDLIRRVHEHKSGVGGAFTKRYGLNQLIHYEAHPSAWNAIEREKQIKGWVRAAKSS